MRAEKNNNDKTDQYTLPFVSVVMPIRNEAAFIESSLEAVLKQDYPHDLMEVLIVDGMSTDLTRHTISEVTEKKDIAVHLLDNPAQIVPAGMNIAIRRAKGDIIVRVDGHTIIEPDYVRNCVNIMRCSKADNVGGPMRAVGDGYVAKGVSLVTSTPFGLGNSQFHYSDKEQFVDTVYMGAFRKETLIRVGLFDETFVRHQDYELNYRIRKSGGKIFLSPKIRSYYYVRDSLRKLWNQYFQYGNWKGRFVRKFPDSIKWRHLIPPAFILLVFLSGIFSIFSRTGNLIFGITLGAYLSFVLTAAIYFILKGKFKYLPIVAVILPSLHLSWGIGFWKGLFMKKLY